MCSFRSTLSPTFQCKTYTFNSHQGFPSGTSGKESACQWRRYKRHGFNPWVERSPGVGNGNTLQYSCLGNPMDRGDWWPTVYGVAKSWTQLCDWACTHTHTHTHTPPVACGSDAQWWCPEHWVDNTDHSSLWNTVGSWKPLVTTFSSTDQYVTCLETPYSIPIADSSTLNSRPIALWLLLECSLSDKCNFLTRHIPASFLFHFKKLNSDMYQYKYWYSILFSDDFLL